MDGVTGLLIEPIDGYKNEVGALIVNDCTRTRLPDTGISVQGTIGALKGTGRGRECRIAWFPHKANGWAILPVLNVGFRPAAGSLALVTKPVKGAFFSIMSSFTPSTSTAAQLRSSRVVQGVEHSAFASDTEKLEVVKRWHHEVRKVRLKERSKQWERARK